MTILRVISMALGAVISRAWGADPTPASGAPPVSIAPPGTYGMTSGGQF